MSLVAAPLLHVVVLLAGHWQRSAAQMLTPALLLQRVVERWLAHAKFVVVLLLLAAEPR